MIIERSEVILRAMKVIGRGFYKLGAGGRTPLLGSPFNVSNECDCSGFVCWAWGLDRKQHVQGNDLWLSTDGLIDDAFGPMRFFRPTLGLWSPGDLVVYGSRWVAGVRTRVGHVGILAGVGVVLADQSPVIHCSAGAYKNYGAAVAMTGAAPWMKYKDAKNGTVILTPVTKVT